MKKGFVLLAIVLLGVVSEGMAKDFSVLYGQWKGIALSQDSEAGAFFLPNSGQMILDESSVHLYFYPYFKSGKYPAKYSDEAIFYTINGKTIKNNYQFKGDTLVFRMNYIGKTFVKMFVKVDMEDEVLSELNQFGFKTAKLNFEYELDTLREDTKIGFENYTDLGFEPIRYIKFKEPNKLIVNREIEVDYTRTFKRLKFNYKGVDREYEVYHIGGTQSIQIIPVADCQCDSILLPYMAVKWADRIRQSIIDEENF